MTEGSSLQEQPRDLIVPNSSAAVSGLFPFAADLANAGRIGVQDLLDLVDIAHRSGNRQITNRASFQEEGGQF